MTRQQLRQAQRRLKNGDFPFPELMKWIRDYLKRHPECFAQARSIWRYLESVFAQRIQKVN
ncbi:MAG: hypothetical protein OXL96_13820 [Candidatus Poribacteria bacterium]|nr:hypothetical protein [Candidatus Poribacteria bacterium]